MSKVYRFKLLYITCIYLIFFLAGCVDTSVQNLPTSIDYHSQIQIVNLASLKGSATIDVVNSEGKTEGTTGTLNVGDAFPADGQPFMDIPSGTKTFKVTFANNTTTSFRLTIDTERKMRLLLYNPDSTTTDLIKVDQRYTWQQKNSVHAGNIYPADSASVSFLNASLVPVDSVLVQGTPVELSASLKTGNKTSYMLFSAPISYTIAFKDTANLATATVNAQPQSRYSAIIYGTQGKLQAKVYTDD